MTDNFLVYSSMVDTVFKINDPKLRAEIAEAILYYGGYGELPENLSYMADVIMTSIVPNIDSAKTTYNAKRKAGASKGKGAGNQLKAENDPAESRNEVCKKQNTSLKKAENDPAESRNEVCSGKEKEKEKEYREGDSKGNGECVSTSARKHAFHTPTIAQVREYCAQRQNAVDPERFVSYYESNGWRVGKNPMKDWQAAVRSWERGDNGGDTYNQTARSGTPRQGPDQAFQQRTDDLDALAVQLQIAST